jgi:hypothetical protein
VTRVTSQTSTASTSTTSKPASTAAKSVAFAAQSLLARAANAPLVWDLEPHDAIVESGAASGARAFASIPAAATATTGTSATTASTAVKSAPTPTVPAATARPSTTTSTTTSITPAQSATSPSAVTGNELWADRFRPHNPGDLVGNPEANKKLVDWLVGLACLLSRSCICSRLLSHMRSPRVLTHCTQRKWQEVYGGKGAPGAAKGAKSAMKRCVLLSGPPGIGVRARACALNATSVMLCVIAGKTSAALVACHVAR